MLRHIKLQYVLVLGLSIVFGGVSFFNSTAIWPSAKTQVASIFGADSRLSAYYTFDDGTATDSAGSNSGSLSGGAVGGVGKIGGGSVSLDGVDDMVSTPVGLSGTDFSYSFWVKSSGLTSGAVISFGSSKFCGRDGTNLRCTVDGDSSGSATAGGVYDGSWHHIVFVNSGNTQVIYKDGSQAGSATEVLSSVGGSLRIGNRQSSSSFFAGSIDDVRVYSRALLAGDVSELYAFAGNESGGGGNTPIPPVTPPDSGTGTGNPIIQPATTTPPDVIPATTATLTISKAGTGSGTVSGTGISCGSDCTETVNTGTIVTLTATPASGSTFTSWSGGGCSGTGSCAVTLSANKTVIAIFTATQQDIPMGDGTNWYVDGSVSSSGDGKSWGAAWKTFAAINWALVKPGNTVWVSGGNYQEYVKILTKGTQSQPIRIKASQESGHNGFIEVGGISMNDADWVTVDGAKNDGYGDSVIGDNTLKVPLVKNNINMKVWGFNMGTGSLTGFKIKWVEITTADAAENYGIRFNPTTGFDKIEFSYLWIHDTGQDGMVQTQNSWGNHYDTVVFHHNLVEGAGDDGIEGSGGNTIHHNYMRNNVFRRGHPDGLQLTGNYQRIYSNVFENLYGNSNFRIQGWDELYTHIEIYNNLLFSRTDTKQLPNPTELVWYGNQAPWNTRPESHWKDWVIVNNTFADFAQSNSFTFAKRAWLEKANIENLRVQNNIFFNISKAGQGGAALSIPGGPDASVMTTDYCKANNTCWVNSFTQSIFDNNVVAKTDPKATINIGYITKSWANAEELNVGTPYKHNTSAVPKFINAAGYDYSLMAEDTAARNKGVNLSFLNLPGVSKDITGNTRGADGAWDIGAFEYNGNGPTPYIPPEDPIPDPEPNKDPAAGLVAHLSFDADDIGTGVFKDSSGKGNSASCQKSFVVGGKTYVHDQCPTVSTGPDASQALTFAGSTCDMNSKYIALPKSSSIGSLAQGTVAVWVNTTDSTYFNQKVLDTFTANTSNTWLLGRDGDPYYTLTINADSGGETDILTFPSATTGTWNHYAFTWDGSVVRGYFNGIYFGQTSMTGFTKFAMSDYMALGALKHNYSRNYPDNNCGNQYKWDNMPPGPYVYPNAGFLNGQLDEVRIYNRALSASDISGLAGIIPTPSTKKVLSVAKVGTGYGGISGGGIGCGKHCAENLTAGSSVTLTAYPDAVSVFAGWSGACSGIGTCTVTMSDNRSVVATFNRAIPTAVVLPATSAVVTSPFNVTGGALSQWVPVTNVTTGGKAVFNFTVPEAGEYYIVGKINAPSGASNSFFINIDAEPTGETMAWFMNTTANFEDRIVSWGGDSNGNNPPHIFTLTAGAHTLIVRGREGGTAIYSLALLEKGGTMPVATPVNGTCSTTVVNQCTTGTFVDISPDSDTKSLWSCLGVNGGVTASCSLPIVNRPVVVPVLPPPPAVGGSLPRPTPDVVKSLGIPVSKSIVSTTKTSRTGANGFDRLVAFNQPVGADTARASSSKSSRTSVIQQATTHSDGSISTPQTDSADQISSDITDDTPPNIPQTFDYESLKSKTLFVIIAEVTQYVFSDVYYKISTGVKNTVKKFQSVFFNASQGTGASFHPARTQLAAVSDFDSTNLLAHYTFDDSSASDSLGSHNGTPHGALSYVDGRIGKAASFNGTDAYIDTGSDFIATSAMTFCAWLFQVNPAINLNIFNNGQTILTYSTENRFAFSSNDHNFPRSTANASIANIWQHLCVTRDATGATVMYVNGSSVGGGDSGTPIAGGNAYIATRPQANNNYVGLMDDIRIYNKALSSGEVSEIYTLADGNVTTTPDSGPDTTAPAISFVGASTITQAGATISWLTNESADTQVEYGLTSEYGNSTTLISSQTTSHSQNLQNLNSSTLYHYRVKSKDAAGNLAQSEDKTFTTSVAAVIVNPKTITVAKTGTGQGTISAPGIDCGSDCTETYEAGSWIYLTAIPNTGSAFSGWSATSCHTIQADGRCLVILAPNGNGAEVSASFGLAAAESGTTVAAASCASTDVQSAINQARDGHVVLVPAGTCTWTTTVGISQKSIILKGAGIDQTTILGPSGVYASVSAGKPIRISGFTFDGSTTADNHANVEVVGPTGSPLFRIDHIKFNNVTERGIIANAVYGLIDHNTFIRIPSGSYAPTLISVVGDSDASWSRPQDMGTSNAVFMEDNIFVHSINANGPFDMYNGARYVFRDNNVYGNNAGHHGFDSDTHGEVNFEIYNNCLVNAAPTEVSPYVLHSYSDCSVHPLPAGNPFAHGVVFEFRSGSGVLFNNMVTRVPTGNNGGYFDVFAMLRNYRSGDGFIANNGGPIPWNHVTPWNGVCDGTNPLDGNLPGMSGYPCKDQIGRTSGIGSDGKQTLSPVYAWNNNFQGNVGGNLTIGGYATFMCPPGNTLISKVENPAPGTPYTWVCKNNTTSVVQTLSERIPVHVVEGRDYFNGTPRPGYTPYQYPHPFQTVGFTSDAGGPVITVPVGNAVPDIQVATCTSFTYSEWGTCTNSVQTHTILTSSPSGCIGGSPVVSRSCTAVTTPVNGICSATRNQCTSGTYVGAADTSTKYNWSCVGANSGTTATCSSNKSVVSSFIPVGDTAVSQAVSQSTLVINKNYTNPDRQNFVAPPRQVSAPVINKKNSVFGFNSNSKIVTDQNNPVASSIVEDVAVPIEDFNFDSIKPKSFITILKEIVGYVFGDIYKKISIGLQNIF